jgi:hypothetical protein
MQIICISPELPEPLVIFRKMLLIVLMFSLAPAKANLWVPYWYDDEVISQYDPIRIKKDGNKVVVEVIRDLLAVQNMAAGKQYLSLTSVIDYDCDA